MGIENRNMYLLIAAFLICTLGCANWKEARVTITRDYVINPNWDKIDNSFTITKMKLIDDINHNVVLEEVSSQWLLHALVEDTSFAFTTNVNYNGEEYAIRKVYFNKSNGFLWRKPPDIDPSRGATFESIGKLQQNTWYLLRGLGAEKTLYYIYLDTNDSLHTFRVPASDWTNI